MCSTFSNASDMSLSCISLRGLDCFLGWLADGLDALSPYPVKIHEVPRCDKSLSSLQSNTRQREKKQRKSTKFKALDTSRHTEMFRLKLAYLTVIPCKRAAERFGDGSFDLSDSEVVVVLFWS